MDRLFDRTEKGGMKDLKMIISDAHGGGRHCPGSGVSST